MLIHPTLDQLHGLGLHGMAKAFNELSANDEATGLGHADWLALLLEREAVHRQDKRLGARLRHARLRHHAVPEDIDYRAHRGIDRKLLAALVADFARTWAVISRDGGQRFHGKMGNDFTPSWAPPRRCVREPRPTI